MGKIISEDATNQTPPNEIVITKPEMRVLHKIMDAQISGTLPAQVKSKYMIELEKRRIVAHVEKVLPGRFPVTIRGWEFTQYGFYEYCRNC